MSTNEQKSTSVTTNRQLLWPIPRLISVMLAGTTLVTLFARHHWLADLLANLRIQQCLVLLFILIACLVYRKWTWIALTFTCLLVHLPWLMTAFPDRAVTHASPVLLKITAANVLTQNQRHDDIIADVLSHAPDIFVILELSDSLASALDQQVKSLYPHSILCPMDTGNFGIGLYSRYPLVESELFVLNTEIPSISAAVQIEGKPFRIFATHPLPPIGADGYRLRNEHLQQLAAKIRNAMQDNPVTRVVLVGDLNLTPWSPLFAMVETNSGLRRAFDRLSIAPTWYRYPFFPFGLMLDHVLISDNLSCQSHDVGPETGSDHRSVTVEIAIAEQQ